MAACLEQDVRANSRLTTAKETAAQTPTIAESEGSIQPSDVQSDGAHDWKIEFARVSARYNTLSENFKKAKTALEKRKIERDRWMHHAQMLQDRIKDVEKEHGLDILKRIPMVEFPSSREYNQNQDGECLVSAEAPVTKHPTSSTGSIHEMPPPPKLPSTLRLETSPTSWHAQPTRESYEDELPELPPSVSSPGDTVAVMIKEEPSSDGPVIVSERSLRKRRRESSVEIPRVKIEAKIDSSPSAFLTTRDVTPQESLDLGDHDAPIMTPRKRIETETIYEPENAYNSVPKVIMSNGLTTVKRRLPSTWFAGHHSSVLAPISANSPAVRSNSVMSAKSRKHALDKAIAVLADDGGPYDATIHHFNRERTLQSGLMPARRVDVLLNGEEVDLQVPLPRKVAQTRHQAASGRGTGEFSVKKRLLPFEQMQLDSESRDANITTTTPNKSRASLVANSSHKQVSSRLYETPDQKLREKPLSELRSSDFKINPTTNDGHDFAFTEVVRDRAERACLPGCVDLHCCGKEYRKLAISQRPNSPLSATELETETKLLKGHLGELSFKLTGMTKEKRYELWVEAKTQELANKFGKHRHRFSRMQSPPGFWNADFPSTQELQADKEESERREKKSIQAKRREALRPGGKWVFRDE